MRNRTRTLPLIPNLQTTQSTTTEYTHHPEWNYTTSSTFDIGLGTEDAAEESSTMQDDGDPVISRDTKAKRRTRAEMRALGLEKIEESIPGVHFADLKPVKRCTHTREFISLEKDMTVEKWRSLDLGNPVFEKTVVRKSLYSNGASMVMDNFPFLHSFKNFISNGVPTNYEAGGFIQPDWFELADAFNEATSSFVNSSFFAGETVLEGRIFIDAIKMVLNPSRSIQTLINVGKLYKKKMSKMSLKDATHFTAREVAGKHLGYKFGVRPAIEDVGHTIAAHNRVTNRMNYLKSNGGKYVPVRVRRILPSSVVNEPPGPNYGNTTFYTLCSAKRTVATIGGYARVREDLTGADTYRAYLQHFGVNKVVGLAWELVPFSFVLDWFTNAQERINSLTRIDIGGPFVGLTHICSSYKEELHETIYMDPGYDPITQMTVRPLGEGIACFHKHTTSYTRIPGLFDTSGVVDLSTLGSFHAITGAELILQLWR